MIEFKVFKTLIQMDFSFFAVLALCFFLDSNGLIFASLTACLLHETGHLLMMLVFRLDINSVIFYGAGIRLCCNIERLDCGRKTAVLGAGCAVNLLSYAVSFLCGSYAFASINLMMCAFNLIPIGDLDGAQLADAVCERYRPHRLITYALKLLPLGFLAAVVIMYGGNIGVSFYLTALYMCCIRSKIL